MQIQQGLGQQQQFATQELQQRKGKELDSFVNIVRTEIKTYGEANGYSYIFGYNDSGNILYGSNAKDISEEIIKELNAKYLGTENDISEK